MKPRKTGPLTKSEARVLAHIFMGKSNDRAAKDLFVGVKTVKFHITNANHKLGTKTMREATHKFFLGQIPSDDFDLIQKYFEPLKERELAKMKAALATVLPRGVITLE